MESIYIWIGGLIVAAIPSIFSGIFLHQFKRQQKTAEDRESDKSKYEYLCMESLNSLFVICKELYNCRMLGRTPNGELEEAFTYMQQSKHNLENHLRELASRK